MATTHTSANHYGAATTAGQHQSRLLLVLGLTLFYVVAEVAGGLATHSLALLADAGHLFTDALGLGMALSAIRFAQRPATPSKTYGFYRAEILAAFANGVVLLGVAAYILFEAWQRFHNPPEVHAGPMLVIALGGVVVTLMGVALLRPGSQESLNVRGAFLEVLSDLLGSVGTVVAAIIILTTGWSLADPLFSALVGLLILPRAWALLRSVVDVLLEATPSGVDLGSVARAIAEVQGVTAVHDLHVWTITSGFIAMSGHVEAKGRPSDDVLHDIQRVLRDRFDIEHTTLQVEQCDHTGPDARCYLDPRCLTVGEQAQRSM